MPCKHCARSFFSSRLRKHESVCGLRGKKGKAGREQKKREDRKPRASEEGEKRKKPDWREKRQHFQDMLKSAKEVSEVERRGGNVAELPITYSVNPDFIACSHCKRTFAPANIERHERICKELARPFARRAKSKSLTRR